jgi:dolichol kinase
LNAFPDHERFGGLLLAVNYRAIIHASSILVPFIVETITEVVTVAALCAITAAYIVEELLRVRGRLVPVMSAFTLRMSRPDERDHVIASPIFLASGIILALILFPRNIAYASIAILAIGDPTAAYIGGKFGQRRVGRRSWEGFAAGTCAAFIPTVFIISPILGAIGSVVGMLLELTGVLDDNLTIPLGSGVAMLLAAVLLLHLAG